MVRRLLLALALLLLPSTVAAQGIGLFIRGDCDAITSPVTGSSWCFEASSLAISVWDGAQWVSVTGGSSGGAPPTAAFILQTANGFLPNAQTMSALGTGLVKNTTATGVQSIYGGAACTNQFIRSLDPEAAATCATVDLVGDTTGTLTVLKGGTGVTDLTFSGSTHKVATTTGSLTNGHCVALDASGNFVDFGAGCGGTGSGSFTDITTGTNATTLTMGTGGALTFAGSGTVNANRYNGNAAVAVADGGTGLTGGTSGGIPGFVAAGQLASSGALPANGVVLGGGAGQVPTGTTAGTANQVLRVPGAGGAPAFGALDLAAAAAVTGILPPASGGTNSAFTSFTGPSGSVKTFTLPNASSTILTSNAAVTAAQGGTGTANTPTAGRYLKGDGSGFVTSAGSASGTGACTNQVVTGLNSDAAPTCSSPALDSAIFANQGTSSTVLHGNASGNPSFGAVALATEVAGILPGANGGTGNGFTAISGPTTSLKTFTLPDASAAILTDNAAVTAAQGGTGQTTSPDDNVLVGSGAAWALKALPSCANAVTSKLLYDTATNAFSCGTDQSGGGGGAAAGAANDIQTGDGAGTFTVDTGVFVHDATNHVTGLSGVALKIVSKTTNYTATLADHMIAVDATSGAVTITLPAASTACVVSGQCLHLVVKKVDSSANAVTVQRSGADTIDGDTSAVLNSQWTAVSFVADGTSQWLIY